MEKFELEILKGSHVFSAPECCHVYGVSLDGVWIVYWIY
jgi:hypothetical protein